MVRVLLWSLRQVGTSIVVYSFIFGATCPYATLTFKPQTSRVYCFSLEFKHPKRTHPRRNPHIYASVHVWYVVPVKEGKMPTTTTQRVASTRQDGAASLACLDRPQNRRVSFLKSRRHPTSQEANDRPENGFGLQLHYPHKATTTGLVAIASSTAVAPPATPFPPVPPASWHGALPALPSPSPLFILSERARHRTSKPRCRYALSAVASISSRRKLPEVSAPFSIRVNATRPSLSVTASSAPKEKADCLNPRTWAP